VILRCTKKLLGVIGPNHVEDLSPAAEGTDWYANLLSCERRKCLLLTHAATLFSAVQAGVSAADLRSTRHLVLGLIARELTSEGLAPDTFGDLTGQTFHITTTADRSILGCMHDMAMCWQTGVAHQGGLANADLAKINRSLRRNINSSRNYERPIDLVAKYHDAQHA
jgi:hypothetical protein